jgi:hypothetical protein
MFLFVVCGLAAVVLIVGTVQWGRNRIWGLGSGDYPYYVDPGTLEEAERQKLASERTYERKEASPRVYKELMDTHPSGVTADSFPGDPRTQVATSTQVQHHHFFPVKPIH